jgi:hypothetical protein
MKPVCDARPTYRSITWTIILTFAVSFAFLYWKQKSREAPTIAAAPIALPQVARPQPAPQLPMAQNVPPSAAAPAASPARPAPEANVGGPPLPVLFKVTQRTVRSEESAQAEMVNVAEAHILNPSDNPLAVTVIDVNLPTMETSRTQVMMGPNTEAHVGTDEGLTMRSGDQITLRSAGFSDLTLTVP